VLGSVLSGAAPIKATETVEIDGKGIQKTKSHEVKHAHEAKHGHEEKHAHESKPEAAEHAHAKKAAHESKESHEVHEKKEAKEAVHEGVSHATEAKGEEHHKHSDHEKKVTHSDKEHATHASMAQQSVFSDEEEDDAALDELEAMTIARTFEKKHSPPWGPPAAVPCTWQEWENDGSCSYTCGGRGKTGQKQTRGKNPPKHGGSGCHGKASKQIECAIEECPTTTTTTEEEMTTTTAGGAPRMADFSSLTLLMSLTCALSLLGWARQ
jgi:hypothetical protein